MGADPPAFARPLSTDLRRINNRKILFCSTNEKMASSYKYLPLKTNAPRTCVQKYAPAVAEPIIDLQERRNRDGGTAHQIFGKGKYSFRFNQPS